MKRAMKFISIILIVCLSVQAAGPLQFAPRPAEADAYDDMYPALYDGYYESIMEDEAPAKRDELGQQKYNKNYGDLTDEEKSAVDEEVESWAEAQADERTKAYINDLRSRGGNIGDFIKPPPPGTDSNEDDYGDSAGDGNDGSGLTDIFDNLGTDDLLGLIAEIVSNISEVPFSTIYDVIMAAIEGDTDGAVNTIVEYVVTVLFDEVTEYLPNAAQLLMDVVQIIAVTVVNRAMFSPEALSYEVGAILVSGLGMLIACAVAIGLAEAVSEVAYVAEVGALIGIVALDIAVAATSGSVEDNIIEWDKDIRDDYADDHKPLPEGGRTFNSFLGKYRIARALFADEGVYKGISYAPEDRFGETFDLLNPAYGETSGLYIDEYKKSADDWKQYARGHAFVVLQEKADFDALNETIEKLANDSLNKVEGYTQAMEARAQTYAFAAQQAAHLRHDIARQIDIRARQALDRQKRRSDLHAAFGHAAEGGALWTGTENY